MIEKKFDSKFHRWYVGGEGNVEETENPRREDLNKVGEITVEDILAHYRKYVNDPKAELPQVIIDELKHLGKM